MPITLRKKKLFEREEKLFAQEFAISFYILNVKNSIYPDGNF